MAIEPTPDTFLQLQTEINIVKAQTADLQTKVRQRRLIELRPLEEATIARAHRVRDQLMTAPVRHAALLAAREGLDAGTLNAALVRVVRAALCRIAAEGPRSALGRGTQWMTDVLQRRQDERSR